MDKIISIRGAVSAQNTKQSIIANVTKLIDRIYFKNGISDDNVINITISVTDDLTAYSAAQAIRENGHIVPLFSAVEPNIDGALKNCIRVMVTAYSENVPYHLYLNGARRLRSDLTDSYSIALDGPSGAGKSTVAKIVAKRLGITYLDTGALYRALGLKCLNENVSVSCVAAVEKCLTTVDVNIEYLDGVQRVMLNGSDVSDKIRTPDVSMAASAVSAIPYVRQKLLGLQREIAAHSSVILDGRDIGTVVLPDSEFKYFLTASAEVRAKRRFDELKAKGQNVTYDEVYNDVVTRDRNDSTRAVAPLKCAFDAIEINSDKLSAEQVADFIVSDVTEDIEA